MKFLGYTLGDANTQFPPPTQELYEQMDALIEEATKAGVLLATGGLAPPNDGVKVRYQDGEFTVLDGPFSEAREMAEAIEWTKRFLTIAGEGESTIRPVFA